TTMLCPLLPWTGVCYEYPEVLADEGGGFDLGGVEGCPATLMAAQSWVAHVRPRGWIDMNKCRWLVINREIQAP
ncbi:hypothetical protein ACFY5D_22020, partial [Paeniglutamicibacter sp. NPDC012692]|uniref:hypothetical protein n=1 Tax=Paeniglutamicibacter sp. NPDC012692 TaxID=3364388 RepID=UPI0036BE7456